MWASVYRMYVRVRVCQGIFLPPAARYRKSFSRYQKKSLASRRPKFNIREKKSDTARVTPLDLSLSNKRRPRPRLGKQIVSR